MDVRQREAADAARAPHNASIRRRSIATPASVAMRFACDRIFWHPHEQDSCPSTAAQAEARSRRTRWKPPHAMRSEGRTISATMDAVRFMRQRPSLPALAAGLLAGALGVVRAAGAGLALVARAGGLFGAVALVAAGAGLTSDALALGLASATLFFSAARAASREYSGQRNRRDHH